MINQILFNDIISQPEALVKTYKDSSTQLMDISAFKKGWKRVIFSGSGDSYFAPLSLQYLIRKYQTREVIVISSMEAAHYWPFESTDLFVPISFSGQNVRTIGAAFKARDRGAHVLAITSSETSPLTKASDEILKITWASPSRNIPHTVDYITTLFAITRVLEILGGNLHPIIEMIPDLVQKTIRKIKVPCQEIGEALSTNDQFFILGSGPNWGTAQYGAAKLWEACGMFGIAFDLEEFAHGPHKLIAKHAPVFLIAPEGKSIAQVGLLVEGLKALDAIPFVITNCTDLPITERILQIPSVPEEWSPFITCLPLQMLTFTLASAKGYDVNLGEGRVKDIKKVREIQRKWIR